MTGKDVPHALIKPGQRWRYKDKCYNVVLEVIGPYRYNSPHVYSCKIVQHIAGPSVFGSVADWSFVAPGDYEYLEGQDAP